jgi:hypothetical protein
MPSGTPVWAAGVDLERNAPGRPQNGPPMAVQADMTDPGTGLRLTLSETPSGTLQVTAAAGPLQVVKRVTATGDVSLTLRAGDDRVSILTSRNAVVVARGKRAARVEFAQGGTSMEATAVLLAGSPAVRLFRRILSGVDPSTRSSAAGLALELADVLVRTLQDDPVAVPAWREARLLRRPGTLEAETCYSAWETEVLAAWEWYADCYDDFSWWSGGREVCAGLYIIRVESAWFKLIGCSSIKIV